MFNQLYYDKFSKADASQIAITNNHLDGIKYIYSDQKSYLSFYDQYNNTQALKIAEQLIDVEGIEYIYKKTKGNYLQYIYNKTPQENINKAQTLNDLKGFKYILKPLNMNYLDLLYKINSTSKSIETDITTKLYYAAVTLQDLDGVKYILNNTKTLNYTQLTNILKNNNHIIRDVYHKNKLVIAYKLIEAGAKFDKMYIIKPVHNLKLNYTVYENHVNKLKNNSYITDEEHQQTTALLETLFTDPIKKLDSKDLGYSLYEMLISTTYIAGSFLAKIQTIFDQFISSEYKPVQDVIKFIALTNLDKKPIDIILPTNGQHADPHYSGNIILNPHKDYYIYTPINLNETTSALLHEMGHFLFDVMFNNSAKVYTGFDYNNKTKQYQEFQIAAKNTLVNILQLLQNQDKIIASKEFTEIAKYLKTSGELLLNHYIYDVHKGVINTALETSLLTAFGGADKKALQKALSSSQAEKTQILENIHKRFNWSKDDSYLLERITDYVGRDEKQYDIELVNRLPELQIIGLNKKALKQLKPLSKWWKDFITPMVEKLVSNHVDQCKSWIKSGSIINNSKEYCILDLYNKTDVKNLLLNPQTRCNLIETKINSFSYKDGKKSDALIQSNAEKELLYSVQNNEQSKCIESIVSKFNISQTLIDQAFVKATEKGYAQYAEFFLKSTNISLETQKESLQKSISQLNQCIPAKSFDEFCHNIYDSYFLNSPDKTKESHEHVSCILYHNIASLSTSDVLENLIITCNGEMINHNIGHSEL